ncbi:MAG: type II toxin-antitoxin system VapC family toxin [Rubrobacteraceae bacterium]
MDTSVWIDYLGGTETEVTGRFVEILNRGDAVGLTSVILQEVVQGVSSRDEFDRTAEYLGSQIFYHPQDRIESHKEAALIYLRCRQAGVTIRSAIDCLIARVAIEHDLLLLHDDRDFEKMAALIPELALA